MRPCPCGGSGKFKRMIPRTILTSVGHVTVGRRYYACAACSAKQTPFDRWAGLGGRSLTEHARRMVSLAGMSWSFDTAAKRLEELCHVRVSDDTIERVCQEEGAAAQTWQRASDEPARAFAAATGEAEFYTDGLKVNTVDGWREMRLSVFAKREPAAPATPAQWDTRVLNEPTVRLAGCAIASCQRIGASWGHAAKRLGLMPGPSSAGVSLSVLADGARWIWDQAAKRFTGPGEWCVDVFHVSQHLHECGKVMAGEGPAGRAWAERRRDHLLEHDGIGLIRRLQAERDAQPEPAKREAVDKLLAYLAENRDGMWYRDRLARGLPIGSGLIEGACKNALHARLRLNSARWRVRRVERIGALRCLDYSGLWDAFWQNRAA